MKLLEETVLKFSLYYKKDLWDEQSVTLERLEETISRHPNKRWMKEDLCTEIKKMMRLIKISDKKITIRGFE